MKIQFHYRMASWRMRNAGSLKLWLASVMAEEVTKGDSIHYVFTDNEEIRSINNEFLNHDYNTDVITFDYTSEGNIRGEVYISLETVRDNAAEMGISFSEELRRVLVHALLHLCGYDDADEAGTREMRRLENRYLLIYRNEFRL